MLIQNVGSVGYIPTAYNRKCTVDTAAAQKGDVLTLGPWSVPGAVTCGAPWTPQVPAPLAAQPAVTSSWNPISKIMDGSRWLLQAAIGSPLVTVALSMLGSKSRQVLKSIPALPKTRPTHQVEVVKRQAASAGGWIELLRDPDPHFVQRNFHPSQKWSDPELVAAFGTATPHSGDALLHYAGDPPKGVKRQEVPILLVHGATKSGKFFWDPHEDKSNDGLPQYLRERGYSVYAVTFAHNQDDNFLQAQQVANAIDRVKQLEGKKQVDLLGHSKGGVPTRTYCSNFRQDWMTAYRGDVRRLMLVAAPNGGIDYSFRHSSANLVLAGNVDNPRLNAPMSWDSVLTPFGMKSMKSASFSKDGPDYWPGQRQIVAPWDGRYAMGGWEQDWYTTYYGGQGFVSHSPGLDKVVADGDHFIERMKAAPIDSKVQVCVLAGNKPDIHGIMNEYTGPSDGLLFVESALDLPSSTNVVAEKVMPLNHKGLLGDAAAFKWIDQTLSATASSKLSAKEREAVLKQGLEDGWRMVPLAGVTTLSSALGGLPATHRKSA